MNDNNEHTRKQEERAYLDTLALLYPGFPDGRIMASESPDFVIRSGPRQATGIEITRMTRKDFNWLLIIVKGFSNPGPFNIHNQLQNWHIESSFDRVLLIDLEKNLLYPVCEKQG